MAHHGAIGGFLIGSQLNRELKQDDRNHLNRICTYSTNQDKDAGQEVNMRYFKTLDDAFDKVSGVLFDASGRYSPYRGFNVNYTSIATCIIQNVGRFAERFASDFLSNWKDVEQILESTPTGPCRFVIGFGIRGEGVDGNDYIVSRLRNTLDPTTEYVSVERAGYRKVLALEIKFETEEGGTNDVATVQMVLKDLTHDLSRLAPEDVPSWDVSQREALKKSVSSGGYDAIALFLEHDYDAEEDADVTDKRLDMRIEQMSRAELLRTVSRYGVHLPGCPSFLSI